MSTHNFEALRRAVIDLSHSNRWAEAVEEWQVVGVEEDPHGTGICVCGKTGLVYLYEIHNQHTDEALSPIGSSCVNLFEVEELNVTVTVLRFLFELRRAFAMGTRVTTLADLWENGAFPPNEYNRHNGDNDYRFLVDLFNQHHDFSDAEQRKVWVLINRTIKRFVMNDDRLR
jgi:hypothetical protein